MPQVLEKAEQLDSLIEELNLVIDRAPRRTADTRMEFETFDVTLSFYTEETPPGSVKHGWLRGTLVR